MGSVEQDGRKKKPRWMKLPSQVILKRLPPPSPPSLLPPPQEIFKRVLQIADKYDSPLVRERVEKWLVSRCLRGRVRCTDFK